MLRCLISLFVTAALGALVQARAQELADANSGREFAKGVCAECHAVSTGQIASPNIAAPTFRAIANSPGMSRTALIVWFQTPHPTMPNLVLKTEDLNNVISYILSLKDQS